MDFSKKLRGQAFETMMLVISVIVALAILAVLLNILGSFTSPGSNPVSTMHNDLQSIQSTGFGITAPKTMTLGANLVILRNSVIQSVPIQESQLGFFVSNDFVANGQQGTSPVTGTNSQGSSCTGGSGTGSATCSTAMTVGPQDIQVYEVACGNTQATTTVQFCIAIAENGKDATSACEAGCSVS
jgi:hypothetical protein